MLDRFGLCVEVRTPVDVASRVEIVKRGDAFERNPAAFAKRWAAEELQTQRRILAAREQIESVIVPDAMLERAAGLCIALGVDGVRGELTLMRSARALAALAGDAEVRLDALRRAAAVSLRHRLRRNPLDESGSSARIERAVEEHLVS